MAEAQLGKEHVAPEGRLFVIDRAMAAMEMGARASGGIPPVEAPTPGQFAVQGGVEQQAMPQMMPQQEA